MIKILCSILGGALWGLAAAWLNRSVTKSILKKINASAASANSVLLMASNLLHLLVDIAALAVLFLLRNVLPMHFAAAIVSAAVALSLGTTVFSFLLAKSIPSSADERADQPENDN